MRARWAIRLVMASLALAGACAPRPGDKGVPRGDLLVLSSGPSIIALDSGTGAISFEGTAISAAAHPGRLFRATSSGGVTTVSLIRAADGTVAASVQIPGDLAIQVVSGSGELVALVPQRSQSSKPWAPIPRASTDIVVADPRGYREVRRYHLKGNYEAEAFSTDGATLFLINHVPAGSPQAYRVAQLDLASGEVNLVYGREKQPPEIMAGTRLQQVPSADGTKLFTLYNSQPPEYAKGYDRSQARADRSVAFVHTLSLDGGWAACVGLPRSLWGGDPRDEALAFSSARGELFVVDAERGVVAVVDPSELEVTRTARIDLGHVSGQVRAAADPSGHALFVSTGLRLIRVDTETLRVELVWRMSSSVSGLGFSPASNKLFVSMPGRVESVNPSSGGRVAIIRTPGVVAADAVVAVSP